MTEAIIYARVSSEKQVTEGNGLHSQIRRCKDFAVAAGYEVVAVFQEQVSGAVRHRTELEKMFEFISQNNCSGHVLIVDSYDRIGRNLHASLEICVELEKLGVQIVSPSENYEDNYMGRAMRNIKFSFAQMEREQNAERTKNRGQARTKEGYRVVGGSSLGYRTTNIKGLHEPDGENARIIKDVLEGYAAGRFRSFTEIGRYVHSQGLRNNRGNLIKGKPDHIKKQVLEKASYYAGFLEVGKWGYEKIQGKHKPLISIDTYKAIQLRLDGRKPPKYNTDHLKDFPLRGHILCTGCGHRLTASYSSGKTKKYGYYTCKQNGCKFKNVNVPFQLVHEQFVGLLETVAPAPELINFSNILLKEVWDEEKEHRIKSQTKWQKALEDLNIKIKTFAEEVVAVNDVAVKQVFQDQISELTKEKVILETKIRAPFPNIENFEIVQKTLHELLAKPYKLWIEGDLSKKQLVQRLVFPEDVIYDQKERNFPKPAKALIYSFIEDLMVKTPKVARPKGFEPLTF